MGLHAMKNRARLGGPQPAGGTKRPEAMRKADSRRRNKAAKAARRVNR